MRYCQHKALTRDNRLFAGFTALVLLLPAAAWAGVWGQESWGRMYWGNNSTSAPISAPQIESVVADSETLTITMSNYPSGDGTDGWSSVYGYQVVCGSLDPVAFEQTVTIDGLDPGEDYSCAVVARNEIGDSTATTQVVTTDALSGLNIILLCAAIDCAS